MKKIIKIIAGLCFFSTGLIACGNVAGDSLYSISKDGKTITYGLYPQTHVNDKALLIKLNKLDKPLENGWYLYKNTYYAKTIAAPDNDLIYFDDKTKVEDGQTYWFKCEPVKWNVLNKNENQYYVVSSLLLDACSYATSKGDVTIDGNVYHANNYEHSNVRRWLNDDFYKSVFIRDDSHVMVTEVDNSSSSIVAEGTNSNACPNTSDKIFLLSRREYLNSDYVFSNSTSPDDSRVCLVTDWAKARGADYRKDNSVYSNPQTNGGGYYWTRSPIDNENASVYRVGPGGAIVTDDVNLSYVSVRPAITFKVK